MWRRKREELTAQRQAVEKRMALREATAAEFSAVALQSYKQKWKTQRSAAVAAKKRNDEFLRMLQTTQRQVHDTWVRLHSDQSSSSVGLAQEKMRYNQRVEQIYPAWQEQLQRQRVQKLRELEDKKRKVERRRYLAKKSFEKEQTLDDLIRKTRHEVEMAENLEQNELYERELLRTQSTNQAKEVNNSIREVALEARNHLQQQATIHFEATPEIDEELAETFSPRNALQALREGNSFIAFDKNLQYEEEKPVRQIRVEVPARMNPSPRNRQFSQQDPYQGYAVEEGFDGDYMDEIPQELNAKPAFHDRGTAERYQRSTGTGDDYTNLKQDINTDWPATRDPPYQATKASTTPFAIKRDSTSQPQAFPMGTGRLYPILEANEPISPADTPNDTDISETISIAGRDHASTDSSGNVATPSSSSTAAVGFQVPDKIEENRVASSPSTVFVSPIHPGNTPQASIDEDQPIEHQERVLTPEHSFKPPAISIPDLIKPSALSSSIAKINIENSSEKLTDELGCNNEGDVDLPVQHSAGGEDNFSLDAGDTLNQNDDPSNTNTSSLVTTEDQHEINEAHAEDMKLNKRAAGFEVKPRTSLTIDTTDTFEGNHSMNYDFEDKAGSSNAGARLNSDVLGPAAVEVPVKSVNETTPATASKSSSISYSLDLLQPFTPLASTPLHARLAEDDMMLASMQSDDFDLSTSSIKPAEETNPTVPSAVDVPVQSDGVFAESDVEPPSPVPEEVTMASITEKLSPVDRAKALGVLISRVEEGATEGDTLGSSADVSSSNGSKRDLLKMAVGGLKSQVAFFGSDICFEMILDISRDIGPVLFPPKAFEGIMNDQKIRKLHQNNKEKQLDLWKALAGHLKQLVELKAIPTATLVDLFVTAFLAHDPDNQRSQRKYAAEVVASLQVHEKERPLRPHPHRHQSTTGNVHQVQNQLNLHPRTGSAPRRSCRRHSFSVKAHRNQKCLASRRPGQFHTLFKPSGTAPLSIFRYACTSSFKDRSSGSSDVLMSMSSGPMKLSQKLMRGGKMNDYSEFEEEEEVDLQNLIGTKPSFSSNSSVLGRSHYGAKTSSTGKSTVKQAAAEEEDEFDADF
ncbi:hypothetical protein P3T76_000866 [Phytophthora citrophthora]|uniref:Uncharacterized protein n=1 Tax=Phytophthora citrophthora TaxID=4793 RepID=A0AAD9LVW3_9STRA|nr:hypothetical protein P3T76_000866 [Phytophthora citrophthora]